MPGGLVHHVLNRSVAGLPLFRKEADYEAFERILIEAQALHPTRILAWCLMRNHWHFVIWPREEGAFISIRRHHCKLPLHRARPCRRHLASLAFPVRSCDSFLGEKRGIPQRA